MRNELAETLMQAACKYKGTVDTVESYYFDVDNWEFTTADKALVLDDMDCLHIRRIGHFVRQPDIFIAQRYNEENDEYENGEFATLEEAEAWRVEKLKGPAQFKEEK